MNPVPECSVKNEAVGLLTRSVAGFADARTARFTPIAYRRARMLVHGISNAPVVSINGGRMTTGKRGFASMDRNRQREIASKGGKLAHLRGMAHEWTSEEAREAGRKGGAAVRQRKPAPDPQRQDQQ